MQKDLIDIKLVGTLVSNMKGGLPLSNSIDQQESFQEAIEFIERKNEKLFRRVGSRLHMLLDQLPEHSGEIMEIEELFHEINIKSQELAFQEGYKQGMLQRGWFKPIFQPKQKIMSK